MSYALGLKALKRLVLDANSLAYHHAKLSEKMFKGEQEKQVFAFVDEHLKKYHQLPTEKTILTKFPELASVDCPEPPKYYLDHVTNRFAYDTINKANLSSQEILKGDPQAVEQASSVLLKALAEITEQKYRHRIMDFGKEALPVVLQAYYNLSNSKNPPAAFGWPYMDTSSGGALPGDVISFVGRPASGKSFKMLYVAIHNWLMGRNVLFVSMEMNTLACAQRVSAMYAHTNLSQLKIGGYSTKTYATFVERLSKAGEETGRLYVVDGNLAADTEDIYTLAQQLGCSVILIDGGYLLRHRNPRLDRYTKVAENVEAMKRFSTDLEVPTFASWQFNRDSTKKKKGEKAGLEDIGYTDAIGQISSIVLGLMQEEGVETMQSRLLDVLKGRNGEIGQFRVNWDFINMDFTQVVEGESKKVQFDQTVI